jgi:hypothetical protein
MEQSSQENESDERYVPLSIERGHDDVWRVYYRDDLNIHDYILSFGPDELGAYAYALEVLPRIKAAMKRLLDE